MFRNLSFLLPNLGSTNAVEEHFIEITSFISDFAGSDKQKKSLNLLIEELNKWLGENKLGEE